MTLEVKKIECEEWYIIINNTSMQVLGEMFASEQEAEDYMKEVWRVWGK